jgi:peroxiredoxin Q/BCP
MLAEGDPAPDFVLPADDGGTVRLEDLRGKKVVLYFYPKDDTPGCTKEACAFRDRHDAFRERGVVVLGVSKDDVASHRRFKEKYGLPFTLLSDPETKVLDAYGAWGERKMYGRTFMGTRRMTYLIDEEGRIAKVYPKVTPAQHADEILGDL